MRMRGADEDEDTEADEEDEEADEEDDEIDDGGSE